MRTLSLTRSVSIALNGSGSGTASLGPVSVNEVWYLTTASISASTAVKEAECQIYMGIDTGQTSFTDSTFYGSSGDSTNRVSGRNLNVGEQIFAVWSGGDANAIATLVITGTRIVP